MSQTLIVFIFILFISASTQASEDKKNATPLSRGEIAAFSENPFVINFFNPAQSEDLFNRTKYITENYFGFAPEPDYQGELNALNGRQTLAGFNKLYPYFDKERQFARFAAFDPQNAGTIQVYQDRDARKNGDYTMLLAQTIDPTGPLQSFRPTPRQPLAGLRIALDPGHMGGKIWDERTGKFVTDHKGHTISEGIINLQTCLLLKERFEREGATVLITHEDVGPVTTKTWAGLVLKNYIADEIFSDTLEPWFLALLEKAPAGRDLANAFAASPRIKRIFSEEMRYEFFILKEDINARAEKIKAFNADITLVIHYDTTDPKDDPNGISKMRAESTKVYVAGAFEPTEFSSRSARRDFAKHIFNPRWWVASVSLAKSLSQQLQSTLGLKSDKPFGEQVEVSDGVLARNLSLTRQIDSSVLAYVECLYYNDPVEFAALLKQDNPMTIGGASYPYSNRLRQVVDALESGVLKYASTVNNN